MSDYWFFLSHARRDALGEGYVHRFYDDLAGRVGQLAALPTDLPNDRIGYADFAGLEPGHRWPDELSEALQASRTLVCLYSPAYFRSDSCGRELQVFLDRAAAALGGVADGPPTVIPVLWEGADRLPALPPKVAAIQYDSGVEGAKYERGGIYHLISLDANRDSYKTAIDRLAARIVENGQSNPLPRLAAVTPLDSIESAFTETNGNGSHAAEPASLGPGTGLFCYVAASDAEARAFRETIGTYGPSGGRDWRPWFPETEAQVGAISQVVAGLENLLHETLPVDAAFLERVRRAEQANTIVVIVVDPWTLQLDAYRSHMQAFDRSSFVNCGLLITWNDGDLETAGARELLHSIARQTFSRCYVLNTTCVRDAVTTAEELQQALIAVIGDIRRRILQRAVVLREVDASVPMPAISGPG